MLQNAILSILFGLAFLGGAISNSVYASDNIDLYYDLDCDYLYYYVDLCEDLETVYSAQASTAVSVGNRYRIVQNGGGGKVWQIWHNECNLPIFYLPNYRSNELAIGSKIKFANVFLTKTLKRSICQSFPLLPFCAIATVHS